jgi:hypothetical protein
MYPFCVERRRLEIIAVLMVMLFPFDGKWRNPPSQEEYLTQFLADKCEGADNDQVPDVVTDFLRRLEDPSSSARNAVDCFRRIWTMLSTTYMPQTLLQEMEAQTTIPR